jgi:hypothetical protein
MVVDWPHGQLAEVDRWHAAIQGQATADVVVLAAGPLPAKISPELDPAHGLALDLGQIELPCPSGRLRMNL